MNVKISNVITITEPTAHLEKWCRKNLVLKNPDFEKKYRLGYWTGNTPETLSLYERRGDALVLPFGCLRMIAPLIKGADISTSFTQPVEVDYGSPLPLYEYQSRAVDMVMTREYGILQSPAGSGKTQMGLAIVERYGRRALWLCHTLDLVAQSRERAERYFDKSLIGTITGGKVDIGRGITFATVQTMCRLDLAQYRDMWDVIIVDECHRAAGTPTSVTQFSTVLNALAARHKYGLSATVHRADGMIAATYALLGPVIYTVPDKDVADTVMQVGVKTVGTGVRLSRECQNTDGTLNYTATITYLCRNMERTRLIAEDIIREREHSCLILSDRLDHLAYIMAMLPDLLIDRSVMISGKMTTKKGKAEREQALEDMRIGRKKFLFATYSLAKEGLDIPCLDRLFMATPQKDYAVITQSIGRIARKVEGKTPPVCYDYVDDIGYFVHSYRKRLTVYKKNRCYFVEDEDTP